MEQHAAAVAAIAAVGFTAAAVAAAAVAIASCAAAVTDLGQQLRFCQIELFHFVLQVQLRLEDELFRQLFHDSRAGVVREREECFDWIHPNSTALNDQYIFAWHTRTLSILFFWGTIVSP